MAHSRVDTESIPELSRITDGLPAATCDPDLGPLRRAPDSCRSLGDLRWVPSRELMNLHYVGFKWAAQIRAVVRRFERDALVAKL